jgi:hypothetical protein
MSLIRYRPVIKNKEADMAADVSGAWTSLTCYYTLHDKIVSLQSENERLRKAGDDLERVLTNRSGSYEAGNASHEWQSAKGVQS